MTSRKEFNTRVKEIYPEVSLKSVTSIIKDHKKKQRKLRIMYEYQSIKFMENHYSVDWDNCPQYLGEDEYKPRIA